MKLNKKKIKARIRKGKKDIKKNVKFFFAWVKGADLIELKECETQNFEYKIIK